MSKLVSALPSGYPKHCMPSSLAIIGAGRVGRALGRQLREAGWRIGAVLTRSEASARRAVRFIGAGKAFAGMTRQVLLSRVILIATPDDEIAFAARELARIGEEELRGRVVLHTSGAMDSGALETLRALLPLTRQVLDNFETLGPRAAWTGPLSRGDFKVVRAHLQALRRSPKEFVDAYDVLNHLAARALADDATRVLSELERSSVGLISKAKATGGGS